VSLPEISARIRRLQGEWSYKGAYQLCEEFLLACMQEGLSDDHIVILAREHKPTQERFKPNEDCPSTFESRIDATIATLATCAVVGHRAGAVAVRAGHPVASSLIEGGCKAR